MSVQISSVSKLYNGHAVVDNISFDVSSNEIVGLLGPNGAGKSTTMKMICGYLPVSEGKIEVLGERVLENQILTKRSIGYLPESNPLYTEMYVKEFLDLNARIHKINDKRNRISEVIELTGLQKEQNKLISQLSKGYKQRVGLAQAILHDPDVLILDEPISGLDPNQLVEIRSLIKQLGEEKTVIFSSHILQEVQQVCDRIIVLNEGKIVADRPISESGNYGDQVSSSVYAVFENAIDLSDKITESLVLSSITIDNIDYQIETSKASQLKKALFDIAVENGNRLLELREDNSIENIFHELTNPS